MRKILIGIVVIGVLIIIGVFFTSLPRKINEEYTGYIFSNRNEQVKNVPITLEGRLYNRIIQNDFFIGTIKIENQIVEIKSSEGIHSDLDNNKYYYTFNTNKNDNQKGLIMHEASVIFSKDFKEIYGYTSELRERYGEMSIFKSDKYLKTIYDKYIGKPY